MPNYNKVILAGHLTRDPELRGNNGNVCAFGIAVTHKWKTQDGESKEETCFVDCAAFGKTGETIHKHLAKGRAVLIEGRLKLEQWESDGAKRSKHSIAVESFQFLGGKPDSNGEQEGKTKKKSKTEQAIDDDDMPF